MKGLLKTTASQYTALVIIVLVSAAMMYFTFTPYSLFGLREPFTSNEAFGGMPPTTPIKTFRSSENARRTTTYNFGNPR